MRLSAHIAIVAPPPSSRRWLVAGRRRGALWWLAWRGKKGDEMQRLVEQVPLFPGWSIMCGERCLCTRFCLGVVEVRNHRAIPTTALRRPTPLWILPTFLHQVASSQVAIILRPTTEKRHPRAWSGRRYYSQAATLNVAPVDGALAGGPLVGGGCFMSSVYCLPRLLLLVSEDKPGLDSLLHGRNEGKWDRGEGCCFQHSLQSCFRHNKGEKLFFF